MTVGSAGWGAASASNFTALLDDRAGFRQSTDIFVAENDWLYVRHADAEEAEQKLILVNAGGRAELESRQIEGTVKPGQAPFSPHSHGKSIAAIVY